MNHIKVQNIYYMLTYAFRALKKQEYKKLDLESFNHTLDLLSAILIKGVSSQLKRGLNKQYIYKEESISVLRGKIDINKSIKQQALLNGKFICSFDELSENIEINQIIKSTILFLLKQQIESVHKRELKKLLCYFQGMDVFNVYNINWNIKFNKQNATYEMLINICYLIISGMIHKDKKGDFKVQTFLDDQRMYKLYEKFIFEYYKYHYSNLTVSSPHIPWNVDENEYLSLLPQMRTDIVISTKGKEDKRTLIIDAKYYTNSMQLNYNKKTIHSNNLYQIFTYVKNADAKIYGDVSGLLLYAKTNDMIQPNAIFQMSENCIGVETLDLNCDFKIIESQLNQIIDEFLIK